MASKKGTKSEATGTRRKIKTAEAEAPASGRTVRRPTKGEQVVDLLKRQEGATIAELAAATGWQAHSVRGFMSGTVKKKHGLALTSEKVEGRGRVYSLPAQD